MWYRIGTVQVTNGSPNVVGTGTAWVANLRQSWAFVAPDGKVYEVLAVVDDTHLTLATNYAGTSLSGQSYQAYPTQGELRDLAAQVVALISSVNGVVAGAGAGKFADGSASAPGIAFASDVDCGFYRIGTNTIGWATAGVARGAFSSTGLMGLGTMAPTNLLHMKSANPVVRLEGAADSAYLDWNDARLNVSAGGGYMALVAGNAERARIDASGNLIQSAPAVVPSLTAERQLVLNMVSNTVLRISGRGADGTTRSVDLTLA